MIFKIIYLIFILISFWLTIAILPFYIPLFLIIILGSIFVFGLYFSIMFITIPGGIFLGYFSSLPFGFYIIVLGLTLFFFNYILLKLFRINWVGLIASLNIAVIFYYFLVFLFGFLADFIFGLELTKDFPILIFIKKILFPGIIYNGLITTFLVYCILRYEPSRLQNF